MVNITGHFRWWSSPQPLARANDSCLKGQEFVFENRRMNEEGRRKNFNKNTPEIGLISLSSLFLLPYSLFRY
jgi:hypothetical protein